MEQLIKDSGLEVDNAKIEEEHKIIMKIRPPTLMKYPSLNERITITLSSQKNMKKIDGISVFHVSVAKLSDCSDRRPKRVEVERRLLLEERNNKSKNQKKKIDEIKWSVFKYKKIVKKKLEDNEQEEIKEDVKEVKKVDYTDLKEITESTIILQSYIKRWLDVKKLKLLEKKSKKRKNLCLELLKTEKTYVKSLTVAEEVYIKGLKEYTKKKGSGFADTDINNIFTSSYTNIRDLNRIFCNALEACILKDGEYQVSALVSESIKNISPYFKMYKTYCSNFKKATEHVRNLKKKNTEFAELLKKLNMDPKTSKLGLNSYLSLPIQRYKMLLEGIIKNTEKEHPDYEGLKGAIKQILDLADFLDLAVIESKTSEKVMEIHKKFVPTKQLEIAQPHRVFVSKFTAKNGIDEKSVKLIIHLFNDIIVFSKMKFEMFNYVNHIDLLNTILFETEQFKSTVKITNASTEIVLTFKNEDEKKEVIQLCQEQINKLKEQRKHDPNVFSNSSSNVSTFDIAANIIVKMSDEDCVEYVKNNKTLMINYSQMKHSIKSFYVSRDEKELKWEDVKKKGTNDSIRLRGDNIYEIIQGQKTQTFKKKPIKDYEGLSFSLCYGAGHMIEKGWTGKTLDLIAKDKKNFIIFTRALKFILLDQGKTTTRRNKEEHKKRSVGEIQTNEVGNDLYLWGKDAGNFNSLKQNDLFYPRACRSFLYLDVKSVEISNNAVFSILENGKCFSWGSGATGKLGHGDQSDYHNPTYLKTFNDIPIKQVSVGENHTLILTRNGNVWSCGTGTKGQLGIGKIEEEVQKIPELISSISNKKIVFVCAGSKHSSAVTNEGQLYMWGAGNEGQLGFGNKKEDCFEPRICKIPSSEITVKSALGCSHTLVLTKNGNVYSFGDGADGQLGDGKSGIGKHIDTPQLIKTFQKNVIDIAAGAFHSAAITNKGQLYMWGNNQYGQLGVGKTGEVSIPTLITPTIGNFFCQSISCGTNHTVVLTRDEEKKKKVFCCGTGVFGRLGIGNNEKDHLKFVAVKHLEDKDIISVSAGGCTTSCVCSHTDMSKKIKMCMNEKCNKSIGILEFKYNCGYCGGIYCTKCCSKKIKFNLKLESVKVCEICYDIIIKKSN